MKNSIKNKIWYLIPVLFVLVYAKPVDAIMFEISQKEKNFLFWAIAIFTVIYFSVVLLKLIEESKE